MKKIIIAILAVTLLAAGTIFVIAQRAGGGMGRGGEMHQKGHFGMGGGMEGMGPFRGLDLTADQKTAMKAVFDASREASAPVADQLRENHKKMAMLGSDGVFDKAAVETVAAERSTLMSKLMVEHAKAKAAAFAILTPEQRTKALENMKEHGERGPGGGPGRGMRNGGGGPF